MTTKTGTRTLTALAAAGAVALLLGGAILYPQVTQAQDATATPPATEETAPSTQSDESTTVRPGRWGVDAGAALAEALGITADELQAAYQEAAQAALDQAVADGLLTQEQADALAARGLGRGGFAFHLGGRGTMGDIDAQALLADALGISAEELEAAQDEAQAAQLAAAVEAGTLTQEQADEIEAGRALREYVAPRVQQALEDAVAAAVEEGIVTQEQADAFLQGGMRGFGLRGEFGGIFGGRGGFDMGGRGGHGRHGGHGMMLPGTTPDTAPESTPETTPQGQGG
jgi:hypothetical protein